MKLVINDCFGGFSLPDAFCEKYGYQPYDPIDRFNPVLIDWVESHPDERCGFASYLKVVTIPENYTDYYINEYDGLEHVIYVVDGKLCFS